MDGPLIIFVVSLLTLVVLQVFIYGYGSKWILSSANLNTNFSIILGFIFGPVWMIISLIRANHFNLKNIKLIILRFIGYSIGITIFIELTGDTSLDALKNGRMGSAAFFPFIVWFFFIPVTLVGIKFFRINFDNNFLENKSSINPKVKDEYIISRNLNKLFDFLVSIFDNDNISRRNKKETDRILKLKNNKHKSKTKS